MIRQLLELTPWMLPVSLVCLAPLAAGLLFAQTQTHRFAAFAKIKAMMTTGMLPILRRMSWWVCSVPSPPAWCSDALRTRSILRLGSDANGGCCRVVACWP